MDKKMTLVIGIWLSGVVAGVILVARWMGMDKRLPTPVTPAPASVQPPAPSGDDHGLHRFTAPIKTGAKADLVRVRHACNRVSDRVVSTIARPMKTGGSTTPPQ